MGHTVSFIPESEIFDIRILIYLLVELTQTFPELFTVYFRWNIIFGTLGNILIPYLFIFLIPIVRRMRRRLARITVLNFGIFVTVTVCVTV